MWAQNPPYFMCSGVLLVTYHASGVPLHWKWLTQPCGSRENRILERPDTMLLKTLCLVLVISDNA
jgi:hypothetical protein